MPDLRALVRDEPEQLAVDVHGLTVTLAYHPARITPAWLNGAFQMEDAFALARALSTVISSWDIVQDGQPFPPSVENLAALPFPLLGELSRAIGEAAAGGDEGKDSSASTAGSPRASTTPSFTESHPSGNATSPLPASTG